MKTRTAYQPSLFDSLDNHYKINKPIRIIEFFGGVGFTHLGYNRVFSDLQQYKLVEWACSSIIAYDAVLKLWKAKRNRLKRTTAL